MGTTLLSTFFDIVSLPSSFVGKKSVEGKVVLITGSGSGIGRGLAREFAKLGSRLVLVDINTEGNEATAKILRSEGCNQVFTFTCDLSVRQDIYRMVDDVMQTVGDVDILVSNAGVAAGRKILDSSDDSIQRTMDVNVNAFFWLIKAVLPSMIERNSGHIVTISSSTGLFGVAGLVDYCASKSALIGATTSLFLELYTQGHRGVTTTCVSPFFVDTGMFESNGAKWSIMPVLKTDYVVGQIIEAVLTNRHTLFLPKMLYVLNVLQAVLPTACLLYVGEKLGVIDYMDNFQLNRKR